MKLLIFDLDGVITTEATYWNIARQGVVRILGFAGGDPLPLDFIYWIKNHAINHNWDVAFVALSAIGGIEEFQSRRELLTGRALLESCEGYRGAAWKRVHEVCQAIQDASPLPAEGLHSPAEMMRLFDELAGRGFDFAVATGRPKAEALAPLDYLRIRGYFPENRIVTHLEVQIAEREAGVPLGKPNPFVVLRAIYPGLSLEELLRLRFEQRAGVWFVGDTASDVGAACAAGVPAIGVLGALPPGIYREQRRKTLGELGCATMLDSVLDLPGVLP